MDQYTLSASFDHLLCRLEVVYVCIQLFSFRFSLLYQHSTLGTKSVYSQTCILNLQIYLHIIAILLISYRVSVVLGKEALKRENDMDEAIFVPNFIYKNIAICMTCAFLLFNIFFEKTYTADIERVSGRYKKTDLK